MSSGNPGVARKRVLTPGREQRHYHAGRVALGVTSEDEARVAAVIAELEKSEDNSWREVSFSSIGAAQEQHSRSGYIALLAPGTAMKRPQRSG